MAGYTYPHASQPLINEETARFLEAQGLVGPIIGQKRKISTSLLSFPSAASPEPSFASSLRVSSATFSATSVGEEVDEIEVPADLRSPEVFEFLGFNNITAAALWQRFITQPADMVEIMGYEMLDFARARVEEEAYPDATSGLDDWEACMDRMGLSDPLKRAILLPEFEDIRYTASCMYWVMDAMEARWETLESFDGRLRMAQARIRHQAKVPRGGPKARSISATTSTMVDAPASLEGHTMLSQAGNKS